MKQDGNKVKLSVKSLPTAVIGRYQFYLKTRCPKGGAVSTHDPANDVYMLFNPWCKDDAVFMDDKEVRQEYVLNDVGLLYYGTERQIGYRTWDYGQFDEGIIAICLYRLEKSEVCPSSWVDPVNVVRVISAMETIQVERVQWFGVAVWKSCRITSDATPVKYGQCWVFGGITITVLRCWHSLSYRDQFQLCP
ncbi:hypothetical protein LDENG_00101290 [Lucifuga dentata]|nr:hypothetical protein LDENG_00101290 [Lucifuga dentata]